MQKTKACSCEWVKRIDCTTPGAETVFPNMTYSNRVPFTCRPGFSLCGSQFFFKLLFCKLQWCYYNDMHSTRSDFSSNCMFHQATPCSRVILENVLVIRLRVFQEFRTKRLSVRPVLFSMNPAHTSRICKPQLMFGRSSGVTDCSVSAPFHPPWFQQIRYSLSAMAGVL